MKNKTIGLIILLLVFVLFNTLTFLLPISRTSSFWVDYVFAIISFVLIAISFYKAFNNKNNMNSKFLSLPIIHLMIVYFIFEMALYFILIFLQKVSIRLHIILNVILFCIMCIIILISLLGKNEIDRIDNLIDRRSKK